MINKEKVTNSCFGTQGCGLVVENHEVLGSNLAPTKALGDFSDLS